MSWFKSKDKEPELRGWRIIEQRNKLNGHVQYRVFLPGWHTSYASMPSQWEDFETLEEAEAFYAEKAGWSKVREFQPQEPA